MVRHWWSTLPTKGVIDLPFHPPGYKFPNWGNSLYCLEKYLLYFEIYGSTLCILTLDPVLSIPESARQCESPKRFKYSKSRVYFPDIVASYEAAIVLRTNDECLKLIVGLVIFFCIGNVVFYTFDKHLHGMSELSQYILYPVEE